MAIQPPVTITRRALHHFEFKGTTVPNGMESGTYNPLADHRPMFISIYPPPAAVETNLAGRLVGVRGFYRARLWWDRISDATFQWWAQWVSESYPDTVVTTVILPSPYRRTGSDAPDYHRFWANAYMTRIRALEGAFPQIHARSEHWIEGGAEVWFNRLGGVIDGVPTP